MFSEFNGLPLHALVIHFAVVAVLLAALLGILFVVPRTRRWSRIPFLLVSLGVVAAVYVAKLSGQDLKQALAAGPGNTWAQSPAGQLIAEHQQRGNLLLYISIGFAVVAVAAFALTRPGVRVAGVAFAGTVEWVVCVLVLVGVVAMGVQVYRVGDIGARAVWNPTGTLNFQ
ncbi:MAG: DUF2231 domain-containing protein [Nocardioidaceae bacterium]